MKIFEDKLGKIVLVAYFASGGCSPAQKKLGIGAKLNVIDCQSVGTLTYYDKNFAVITPHTSSDSDGPDAYGWGDMTIPVSTIDGINVLSVAENPKIEDNKLTACTSECQCNKDKEN